MLGQLVDSGSIRRIVKKVVLGDVARRQFKLVYADVRVELHVERVVGVDAVALEQLVTADPHTRVKHVARDSSCDDGKGSRSSIPIVIVQRAKPLNIIVK